MAVIVSFLQPQVLKVTLNEQGLAGSGTRFTCCHSLVAGLVTLNFVEQFTQAHAGFVQLGLGNTYRTPQYLGNFVVLIALDIVQNKYRAVAHGQLLDAAFEIYSVKRSLQQQVGRAHD
jgi:hypothetical protein